MNYKVQANMHLECTECETVRNAPFCPLCHPELTSIDSLACFYTPRFDGLDAYEETLTRVTADSLTADNL